MKSVVTGSSGFLGSALCNHLENPIKFDISTGGDLDTATPKELARLWDGSTEIYHCAGVVGTSELEADPVLAFEQNFMNTLKVLEAAKLLNAHVFFPSKPLSQKNVYTATKRAVEDLCRDSYPHTRILTIFNLFGPNQRMMPVRRMLPYFVLRAMKGMPIELYGDGNQWVDMLYVEDAAKIIIWHLRNCSAVKMDLGGHKMTVKQVAEDVNDMMGNKAGITYLPMRAGEDPIKAVVSDPIIHIYAQIPLTPWEEALRITLESYKNINHWTYEEALAFYKLQ